MNTLVSKTQLSLPARVREGSASLLNAQLVDAVRLRLYAKQAQWSMTDPHLFSLHLLCDQIAREIGDLEDALADRIARLGEKTFAILYISSASRMPDYPLEMTSTREHLIALSHSLAAFSASAAAAAETAGDGDDLDTADVLTDVLRTSDKLFKIVASSCRRSAPREIKNGPGRTGTPGNRADGHTHLYAREL